MSAYFELLLAGQHAFEAMLASLYFELLPSVAFAESCGVSVTDLTVLSQKL